MFKGRGGSVRRSEGPGIAPIPARAARRRTGSVVLSLLVALATFLGVACLCAHGTAPQSESVAVTYVDIDRPDGHRSERACLSPGHQQCGAKLAVDTPATAPAPHPHPLGLPARVDARPAPALTDVSRYTAPPRAPDLHVLQVLRT
ncbi:hypothetical protein ACIQAC_32205 [Streptomyces sp. NPDC088387]|uniref:hypothetical protein n=1 Tax=Streptomyces sp. NPDC088387 TaxID=3365859 RepID=UPI0037F2B492